MSAKNTSITLEQLNKDAKRHKRACPGLSLEAARNEMARRHGYQDYLHAKREIASRRNAVSSRQQATRQPAARPAPPPQTVENLHHLIMAIEGRSYDDRDMQLTALDAYLSRAGGALSFSEDGRSLTLWSVGDEGPVGTTRLDYPFSLAQLDDAIVAVKRAAIADFYGVTGDPVSGLLSAELQSKPPHNRAWLRLEYLYDDPPVPLVQELTAAGFQLEPHRAPPVAGVETTTLGKPGSAVFGGWTDHERRSYVERIRAIFRLFGLEPPAWRRLEAADLI